MYPSNAVDFFSQAMKWISLAYQCSRFLELNNAVDFCSLAMHYCRFIEPSNAEERFP